MMNIPNNPMAYNGVYYAESMTKDKSVNPVAICPLVKGRSIQWGDTSQGTAKKIAEIQLFGDNGESQAVGAKNNDNTLPSKIVVTTSDDEMVVLTKMTLDVYNRFVRHRVAGSPDFKSDDEVQAYFMNTNFDAYDDGNLGLR
ncbi:hypothetical protein [Estrella lausannensis]|uniref:Uncharacterized protein n=1 Tax=Estrella lausannensis TaxID=483423 RepID=A0A0H5DNW5_9BACT|nr:hypothetical protein [Estrella lausannensis]CRX37548.1 hypothetical protein ELAC_0187 [Estrella lausannensis]